MLIDPKIPAADTLTSDKYPDGLIPVVVQDAATSVVLMLGYMSRESFDATIDSGLATFFSRSKGRLWRKGETSGNLLKVVSVATDCDRDALLIRARPAGPTCHLGPDSCFEAEPEGAAWFGRLEQVVAERGSADPAHSYTARLIANGPAKVAQKVGEEGVEVALAAVSRDTIGVTEEAADLLYHLLVLLNARGIALSEVTDLLKARHRLIRTEEEQTS